MTLSRRGLLIGMPLFLAGCATRPFQNPAVMAYGPVPDDKYPLPAMPLDQIAPELRRQKVAYSGPHAPGTIVVNTPERRLYYVMEGGEAMRYGIGVGKAGLALSGSAKVGRKAEWPSWTPTGNMIRRDPRNKRFAGGMAGGLNNPLGARALYLYRGGNDTMFRIHGTNQPKSIGHAMSSGCVRMLNHDVIDLYARAEVGAQVVVVQT
ncbi:L,D-transpeptidase [Corticibacterium sp. UT-5YL-CI-8]|nr:L,D-transpeptidase [Tianweitania sp. UT-5YL-CI-8]